MQKIDKTTIKRILLITLSNVGDIILTTPVAEALLREFPNASLDVVVGPSGKEIFDSYEGINDVILYDKRSRGIKKIGFFLKLRKRNYNLVVDLRNTILPLILGARYITNPLRYAGKKEIHKKDVHLSRLSEIGIDISNAKFNIPVTEKDKENVDKLIEPLSRKPFVVVTPGAKSHAKRWPIKSFAGLCDLLKEKLGFEIILAGDTNDNVVIQRTIFYMESTPYNFIKKTNIRELAYLMKKSSLLVTNDSAPLHVGSAVGANILAFFGPTDRAKYGPSGELKSVVIQKRINCVPCEVAQCHRKENKYECLKSISVEEAFRRAKSLLTSS